VKKIIIYLTVFLVLLALFFLGFSHLKSKESQNSEELGLAFKTIFSFDESMVYKWQVNYDLTNIVMEKKGSSWFITDPPLGIAENDEALANVKNINTCEYRSIVGNTNSDLHKFGLSVVSNYYSIFLTNEKGTKEIHTIFQGNPTGLKPAGYYVRYNHSSHIFQVPDYIIQAFQKEVTKLPKMNLCDFSVENISAVFFKNFSILKDGVFWKFNKFSRESIIMTNVDYLVQDLSFLKGVEIVNNSTLQKSIIQNSYCKYEVEGKINKRYKKTTIDLYKYKNSLYGKSSEVNFLVKLPESAISNFNLSIDHFIKQK
jgi:hypothetical protein